VNELSRQEWKEILAYNNLGTYEEIWALKADWFEEPNDRKGGWSGVSRIELKLPRGGKVGVFLKRQEDHVSCSIWHPIKGIPTFQKESESIERFRNSNIPTLEVIFYKGWTEGKHQRAILITKELAGFLPLSDKVYQPENKFVRNKQKKLVLFRRLVELMHAMHSKNLEHGCFYLKHVFAKRLSENDVELCVIDLEKVKRRLRKKQAIFRDLFTLSRHAKGWGVKDQLAFYKLYMKETKLSADSKLLWRELAIKINEKNKRRFTR
jgi:hypothetical protein